MDKSIDELADETWPDEERMEKSEPVELTLDEALEVMRGDGGDNA